MYLKIIKKGQSDLYLIGVTEFRIEEAAGFLFVRRYVAVTGKAVFAIAAALLIAAQQTKLANVDSGVNCANRPDGRLNRPITPRASWRIGMYNIRTALQRNRWVATADFGALPDSAASRSCSGAAKAGFRYTPICRSSPEVAFGS